MPHSRQPDGNVGLFFKYKKPEVERAATKRGKGLPHSLRSRVLVDAIGLEPMTLSV